MLAALSVHMKRSLNLRATCNFAEFYYVELGFFCKKNL